METTRIKTLTAYEVLKKKITHQFFIFVSLNRLEDTITLKNRFTGEIVVFPMSLF